MGNNSAWWLAKTAAEFPIGSRWGNRVVVSAPYSKAYANGGPRYMFVDARCACGSLSPVLCRSLRAGASLECDPCSRSRPARLAAGARGRARRRELYTKYPQFTTCCVYALSSAEKNFLKLGSARTAGEAVGAGRQTGPKRGWGDFTDLELTWCADGEPDYRALERNLQWAAQFRWGLSPVPTGGTHPAEWFRLGSLSPEEVPALCQAAHDEGVATLRSLAPQAQGVQKEAGNGEA
jgi:hypothetical protein